MPVHLVVPLCDRLSDPKDGYRQRVRGQHVISDGSSTTAFKDITEILPINNDFTVTFIGFKGKGNGAQYKLLSMNLGNVTEDGLFELNKVLSWSETAAMLVTFDAPKASRATLATPTNSPSRARDQ
jgi:hypothetical protein